MVCRNDDGVVVARCFNRDAAAAEQFGVFARYFHFGDVGVVVVGRGTEFFEQFDQLECGAFAQVVHVFFVSEAEQ